MAQSSQKSAAGKEEILQAATDLFAEKGFDAVSVNAIATRACTSKANVFHHFGSKDALYLAVMRQACAGFASAVERLGDCEAGFDARVRGFVFDDLALMRSQPDQAHLILREVLESGPCRGRALASEVFDEQFAQIVNLFCEGQASGLVTREVPPALAASMLVACNVFMFQSQHVLRHLPGVDFVDDPERYANLVGRVLLDGLRPSGDERAEGEGEQ